MRAKKVKEPTGPIRYLLSGDQKLRKLSLRRISESGGRRRRPARTKPGSRPAKPAQSAPVGERRRGPGGARAVVIGFVCVVAAAALVASRQPASRTEAAVMAALPLETVATAPVAKAAPKPAAEIPARPPAPMPQAAKPVSTAAAAEPTPRTATRGPEPATVVAEGNPVTITGCLERGADGFRLTDTSGVDAPTSRSWKSGFLKKRPAPVEVAGGNLQKHVGHRVSVTGRLDRRELQVESVARADGACV